MRYKIPIMAFCLSRILIYTASLLAVYVIPGIFSDTNFARFTFPPFLEMWSIYDGNIFREIAEVGYTGSGCFGNFPLYPLLIRFLNLYFHNSCLSGILISHISFLLALCLLYKFMSSEMDSPSARRSIWYLSLYPFSYFYNCLYSESLFLLLTAGVFYFAKKKNWLAVGLAGMLAISTRGIGLALYPALLYYYFWSQTKEGKGWLINDILKISLMLLGVLTFMFYLYIIIGNPFQLLVAQKSWGRQISWPQVAIIDCLRQMLHFFSSYQFDFSTFKGLLLAVINSLYNTNNAISLVFVILVSLGLFRKFNASYGIYVLSSLAFPLCSANLVSLPRYVIVLFPLFMYLGLLGRKKIIHSIIITISVALLILYVILFAGHIFMT